MKNKTCPHCIVFLLDVKDPAMKGWKYCSICNWHQDKNGANKLYPDGFKSFQNEAQDNLLKTLFTRFLKK